MVKRQVELSSLSPREQEEIYEYFSDIDREKAEMTAKEIAMIEQSELRAYGNLNRYMEA